MKQLLKKRYLLSGLVILVALALIFGLNREEEAVTMMTVERGVVERSISVSGFLEADQMATLSFPTPSRLSGLFVTEGDVVAAGELLATSGSGAAAAEAARARAQLIQAEARRDETVNGLTLEARVVSSSTLAQARTALETTRETEAARVAEALNSLRSGDLEVRAVEVDEESAVPQVTGSYQCSEEGAYELELYRSNSDSGYSIRYEGLESGIIPLSTDQPVRLGDCGLSLVFDETADYRSGEFIIQIPNADSSTYLERLRRYELTVEQAEQNIATAEYALQLAEATADNTTADARIEDIIEANAAVQAAQADVARAEALIRENAIYAPFSGTVSNITTAIGETTSGPVMSIVANDQFTLVARVPEIDLISLTPGLPATVSFDAAVAEEITGEVTFVSPIATVIDGVSYFETNIRLDNEFEWYRDGLNADIDIAVDRRDDVLRINNRYIIDTPEGPMVLIQQDQATASTSIEVLLSGTDGFSAITGLKEGDVVVAPE